MCVILTTQLVLCHLDGDILIEDIEEQREDDNKTRQNYNDTDHDDNNDWIKFQSQFQSVLDSSDIIVHQSTLAGQLQRLKDDLVATAIESIVNGGDTVVEEKEEANIQDKRYVYIHVYYCN